MFARILELLGKLLSKAGPIELKLEDRVPDKAMWREVYRSQKAD